MKEAVALIRKLATHELDQMLHDVIEAWLLRHYSGLGEGEYIVKFVVRSNGKGWLFPGRPNLYSRTEGE